jgi:hypothetical protein
MKFRPTGFTTVAAALGLAALVVVIGAAQAAPSTKSYTPNVRLTNAVTSTSAFTLTLTNDTKSKQSMGSANFTAPAGFAVPTSSQSVAQGGNTWSITSDGSRVVAFRASTNDDALLPNESVSASVNVTVPSSCSSALWQVQAKQSNDFSGQPGNDFLVNSASDLTPLGSFSIATIETVTADAQHVPAILTGEPKVSTTTAYDTCGNVKTTYSGAIRSATLLTGASFSPTAGLNWSNGVGTVTITPAVTETDNSLTVRDTTTGVNDTSNLFDTTDRLCTSADTEPCEWQNNNGRIKVNAAPPPDDASLGIGFNSNLSFSCGGASAPAGGAVVNINPRYENTEVEAIEVTLTYAKSATPGSASDYDVCFRKDEAVNWTALEQCASTSPAPAAAPCFISRKRVTGGDLEVVLWVETDDPWTGLG